jgi:hypothetical protein
VDKVLYCECGFEARGADADGLVEEVIRHASEAHGMALSREEALILAFRAELSAASTTTQTPTDEEER